MCVIPVWIRVLAGLVVAAAVFAIVLLVRTGPGRVVDGMSFIRLFSPAILYLCLIILFGYVAATGLPPSHLLPHAGHILWPAQPGFALTPEIHRFLARIRERHPRILEFWILDAPEHGTWSFLARAESTVVDAVCGDWDIRRKGVRLYLLDEESRTVVPAWGRAGAVSFATWDWEPQGAGLAEFCCPVTAQARVARQLWSLAPSPEPGPDPRRYTAGPPVT